MHLSQFINHVTKIFFQVRHIDIFLRKESKKHHNMMIKGVILTMNFAEFEINRGTKESHR
jgi:hypothetical protein